MTLQLNLSKQTKKLLVRDVSEAGYVSVFRKKGQGEENCRVEFIQHVFMEALVSKSHYYFTI
jgi:hypothetical protein